MERNYVHMGKPSHFLFNCTEEAGTQISHACAFSGQINTTSRLQGRIHNFNDICNSCDPVLSELGRRVCSVHDEILCLRMSDCAGALFAYTTASAIERGIVRGKVPLING